MELNYGPGLTRWLIFITICAFLALTLCFHALLYAHGVALTENQWPLLIVDGIFLAFLYMALRVPKVTLRADHTGITVAHPFSLREEKIIWNELREINHFIRGSRMLFTGWYISFERTNGSVVVVYQPTLSKQVNAIHRELDAFRSSIA